MNTATIIKTLYAIGMLAMVQEMTNLIPAIPEEITLSLVVMALSSAVVVQWRQSIRDRDTYRHDLKETRQDIIKALDRINSTNEKQTEVNTRLITAINLMHQKLDDKL